jgi:hypothetical protein
MGTPSDLSVKQQFLIDFWLENSAPEGWVKKERINLQTLAKISPNLIMLKSVDQEQWKFTLVGTGIVDEYCHDFTGCMIDEIPFEQCKILYRETTRHSSQTLVPHVINGDFCYDQNGFLQANEVSIPISDDGQTVTHVLIVCDIARKGKKRTLYYPDKPCSFSYRISPYIH